MATSNGILPSGESSNFTGAAPDANLVDVRIGTAFGAGPFENYVIEQEFYESAPRLEHTNEYKNNLGSDRKIVLRGLSDFF